MFSQILIGLDGSRYSDNAVELGLRWARGSGARLIGLGVIDEPEICKPEPVPIGGAAFKQKRDQALLTRARHKVRALIERFRERCKAAAVMHTALEEEGDPFQRLQVLTEDVDLTLLGRETYFHFITRDTPDRGVEGLLRKSHRPIALAPATLPLPGPVVVAYDASPPAVRALKAFQASGLDEGDMVHVLSIAADRATAERRAEEGTRFLSQQGMKARPLLVAAAGKAAPVILDRVRRLGARLLVMGAFGRAPIHDLFFGSTTHSLLQECAAVLFLHP